VAPRPHAVVAHRPHLSDRREDLVGQPGAVDVADRGRLDPDDDLVAVDLLERDVRVAADRGRDRLLEQPLELARLDMPLLAITIYAYLRREELFGLDEPVQVGAALVMLTLGWALARDRMISSARRACRAFCAVCTVRLRALAGAW
jgi:hypothetical protein